MKRKEIERLFLPSLVTASFATQPPSLITGLLLIEIGATFNLPVGIAGQIRTASSTAMVITALVMSVLSTRYGHETLLMAGLVSLVISSLGCFASTSFTILTLFYSLSGMAIAIINSMSNALIGEHLSEEKRSGAIGWFQAGTSIAYLVMSPAVSVISKMGGWKMAFLLLLLPISILSLIATYIGVPKGQIASDEQDGIVSPLVGFRKVVSNRSALWCLSGTVLASASWLGSLSYMMSYYRQVFEFETLYASILLSVLALSKTFGHLSVSRFIRWLGRKAFTVVSLVALSILTFTYMTLGVVWLSIGAVVLSCVLAGYMDSSRTSLNLEQVPEYRGSMMSLNSAAYGLGGALGISVGGYVLLSYGYHGLGTCLGFLGLISAVIYHFLTRDPMTVRVQSQVE